MQNRTAVILSLGMLHEKVDASGFIIKMLTKAKQENADFAFTPDLQKQVFLMSENFNKGKLTPNEFETQTLAALNIKTLDSQTFWSDWNEMITMGDIAAKVSQLQDAAYDNNVLFYLASDTNPVHLKAVTAECDKQNVQIDSSKQPMTLANFPLYLSYLAGKSRHDLTKQIVEDIQQKAVNKPNEIKLILGNPENIKDKTQQAIAKREHDAIVEWCGKNNVSVTLHNGSLADTFAQMFAPNSDLTRRFDFK